MHYWATFPNLLQHPHHVFLHTCDWLGQSGRRGCCRRRKLSLKSSWPTWDEAKPFCWTSESSTDFTWTTDASGPKNKRRYLHISDKNYILVIWCFRISPKSVHSDVLLPPVQYGAASLPALLLETNRSGPLSTSCKGATSSPEGGGRRTRPRNRVWNESQHRTCTGGILGGYMSHAEAVWLL